MWIVRWPWRSVLKYVSRSRSWKGCAKSSREKMSDFFRLVKSPFVQTDMVNGIHFSSGKLKSNCFNFDHKVYRSSIRSLTALIFLQFRLNHSLLKHSRYILQGLQKKINDFAKQFCVHSRGKIRACKRSWTRRNVFQGGCVRVATRFAF